MSFLVATNVVNSRPPKHQPTRTPHAHTKKASTMQTPNDTVIDATEATKAKLYSILTTKQEEITTIKETMGNTTIATCLETTINNH